MTSLLVIGYGNRLRSDDAAGPQAAEAVERWQLPGVRVLVLHQLAPEVAAIIADASAVVFLDAALDASECSVERLEPGPAELGTHHVNPTGLLQLARDLYQWRSSAWLIRLPVQNLEFGETLSPLAARGVEQALDHVRGICREIGVLPQA